MHSPGVSVCILTHNEEDHIERCLASLMPPPCAWEILVIENLSTDDTVAQVEAFASSHPDIPLRLLHSGQNCLGFSRHFAVEQARYPLVAFIDADCEAPPQWLTQLRATYLTEQLQNSRLAAVGGGQRPPQGAHPFYSALNIFCSSQVTTLGAAQIGPAREVCTPVYHLATCNVLYAKEAVLSVQSFNRTWGDVCEDVDLGWRLHFAGFTLLHVPGLNVIHHHSLSLNAWAEKIFRYGWGQIRLLRRHRRHLRWPLLAPLVCALILAGIALVSPIAVIWLVAIYLIAMLVLSFWFAMGRPRLALHLWALYLTSHIAAAAGQVYGLWGAW